MGGRPPGAATDTLPDPGAAEAAPETFAVLAGGGTAGHLLPGMALGSALVARGHAPSSIHVIGSDRGIEASVVPAAGFGLSELSGRGIPRRPSLASLRAALGIVGGVGRGVAIVRRLRPAVVVCLGGHAAVGGTLGAVVTRTPLVLLEQNARAGAVNRLFARCAAASAVSLPGTDLPRATLTGNPLRPEIRAMGERLADPATARQAHLEARRALGLPEDRVVVAVYSGSLGSRRINTAVRDLVRRWAARPDVAVYHVTGRRDAAELAADPVELPEGGLTYVVTDYEDRMDLLLAAGDVAVTRSGGTVAELAAAGLPAVLVPLPIATRDHQTANAAVFTQAGAAVEVVDSELDADRLESELDALLGDPDRLAAMSRAMRAQAHLDAAERAAALVESVARPRPRRRGGAR